MNKQATAVQVINGSELPSSSTAHRFEGYEFGNVGVSSFVSNNPPGKGVGLHTHPYPEVFVLHEGQATFRVGENLIEAVAGQILVVPAHTPHGFISSGNGPLRHVDIHTSAKMEVVWLED